MLLSLWCIAVVVVSLFAVGLPLCWILNGKRPLAALDFVRVPFLGVAAIVIVLQNLVVLDVTIKQALPFFWLGVLLTWLWIGEHSHSFWPIQARVDRNKPARLQPVLRPKPNRPLGRSTRPPDPI